MHQEQISCRPQPKSRANGAITPVEIVKVKAVERVRVERHRHKHLASRRKQDAIEHHYTVSDRLRIEHVYPPRSVAGVAMCDPPTQMWMAAPADRRTIRAFASNNTDDVKRIEQPNETWDKIFGENIDVVVRHHDELSNTIPNRLVVRIGERAWPFDGLDLVLIASEEAAIQFASPIGFLASIEQNTTVKDGRAPMSKWSSGMVADPARRTTSAIVATQ